MQTAPKGKPLNMAYVEIKQGNRFTQRASSDIEGRYRVTFYAENQPVTPVIVITARDLTDDDRRRLNGEVARILQKGANSIDDLFAEIRSLIPNQA
jgi:hypothetical protein